MKPKKIDRMIFQYLTVDEIIAQLQKISDKGYGEYPVKNRVDGDSFRDLFVWTETKGRIDESVRKSETVVLTCYPNGGVYR